MEAAIIAGRDARRIAVLESELDRLRHEVAHPFDAEEVRAKNARIADLEGTLRGVRATIPVIQRAAYERGALDSMLYYNADASPAGVAQVKALVARFLGTRVAVDEKEKEG
jgi:hypothetical protein